MNRAQTPDIEALTLDVSGMTCAACQNHVRKALEKTPGVAEAAVNLMSGEARVAFRPAEVGVDELLRAVRDSGYEARLASAQTSPGPDSGLVTKAVVSLALGSVSMWLSMQFMHDARAHWAMLVMTLSVMTWAGASVYRAAWRGLLHRTSDMNTLIALGTGAAFFYSAAVTVAPTSFASHDVYYEAAIFILAFVLTGRALEERAKKQTTRALRELMGLQVPTARVLRNGVEQEVAVASVQPGELVIARPGERLPVDGEVLDGTSYVDESMLTGEPEPVVKHPGSAIAGGTLNTTGSFRYRATTLGEASVLARIVALMRQAQTSRAPIERVADRISSVFVPLVLGLSIVTLIAWASTGHSWLEGSVAAVAVLIIACPCAMGLAVPTAVMVASGRAARAGLLIKSGEALERLHRAEVMVFDKTGTLTEGRPRVVHASVEDGPLRWAAALERRSEHPLGRAVVQYAESRGLGPADVTGFESVPGSGVRGVVEGRSILVGNAAFTGAEGDGLLVSVDGVFAGALSVRDALRPSSAASVQELQSLGLRVVLLSGDRVTNAERIAAELGIRDVIAGVLPEGKVVEIRKLQSSGKVVAMAGDGLNDGPALAQADVGIAMGSGTGVAIEASDITLLRPDLLAIAQAIRLSRATWRVIRQNLFWALAYNVVAIPAAALGYLHPIVASAAMAASSVSVVANSLRLQRTRID